MRSLFLLAVILVSLGWSSAVYAEPKCGKIEEDIVEDAFRAADNIDFHYDVEDELDGVCKSVEAVHKWERKQPRGFLDKAYKNRRDEIIEYMEADMRGITGSLIALRAWIHYDAKGSIDKAKRRAKISRAKKNTQFYLKSLRVQTRYLQNLMK